MRIAIDIRPFLRRGTGVGVLFEGLLTALGAMDTVNRYLLFSSSWKERVRRGLFSGFSNFEVRDHRIPVRLLNRCWHNFRFPPVEWFVGGVDVAHSPHPLLLPSRAGRQVVTIHDLHFLQRPDQVQGEVRRDYPKQARRSAASADLIMTVSNHSREAIVNLLGVDQEKIRIVSPGVYAPDKEILDRLPPLPGLTPGDYLAFVGTLEPRKDVPRLIRAYAALVRDMGSTAPARLALAGGGKSNYVEELRKLVVELNMENRVVFLGYRPREDLWRLYRGAAAVVVCSSVEGFCIPLVEAMASGTPLVAVNASAIPEVAGDAAVLVDPGDEEGLAGALVRVLSDSTLRQEMVSRGLIRSRHFSWDRAARSLLRLYEELE